MRPAYGLPRGGCVGVGVKWISAVHWRKGAGARGEPRVACARERLRACLRAQPNVFAGGVEAPLALGGVRAL